MKAVDVGFQYPGQPEPLFFELNLTVNQGTFVSLVGRSGSGKSTILNLLAGYLAPNRGACFINDVQIVGPDKSRIPIYQEDSLWPWFRVVENVTLSKLLTEGKGSAREHVPSAFELLTRLGLSSESHHAYPKTLSTGMKKRVEIARALFVKPEVILADEPFASLDPETREELHDLMLQEWKASNMSVLFSTHDLDDALYMATEIVILRGKSPTTIGGIFKNPFHGQKKAKYESPQTYFSFCQEIRTLLKGE